MHMLLEHQQRVLELDARWVDDGKWTVLMHLCCYNSQLLSHDLVTELVQQQKEKLMLMEIQP